MYGIVFKVKAKSGKRQELINFLKWDGEVAREKEPGTLRFEFYRDPGGDEDLFYVHEAYQNMEAFTEHQKGEPFKKWSSGEQESFRYSHEVVFKGEAIWFLDRPKPPPTSEEREEQFPSKSQKK